jgi:hypothetical protein
MITMGFEFHPTKAAGTVRQYLKDGAGGVTFDLMQAGDLGPLHLAVPAGTPGLDEARDGADVVVHWTDQTRSEVRVVRTP